MSSLKNVQADPLAQLVVMRVREFIREPAAIFWVYVFPLLMMIALGVAFRERPIVTSTVVIQRGPISDRVASVLEKDERFQVRILNDEESLHALRTGKADLIVVRPALAGSIDYYFDPTKSASVLACNAVDDLLQRDAGRSDVLTSHRHELTGPGGRYIDFLIPGLLGMGLMGGGLWGVGFAIVDLRIRKLLKRYLATPMKRSHFLASIMISRLLFMVPEILTMLIFARFVFGVSSHGSYLNVTLLVVLGAIQFSGIGLLVAARAQTLETISGLMNLIMLPMWIGCGIFFSIERFPDVTQPFIAALPLTPLINALRSVMLEGSTLTSLGWEVGCITAWGALTFFAALRLFRWQ